MRTMTATERAYVAGIIDGEGSIEYVQRNVTRHDRPGKPVHKVWNIRLEVPQVDGRLIDYLIETTAEGTRDMKRFPNNDKWQDQHRWRVAHRGVYQNLWWIIMIRFFLKKFLERGVLELDECQR